MASKDILVKWRETMGRIKGRCKKCSGEDVKVVMWRAPQGGLICRPCYIKEPWKFGKHYRE